MENTTSNDLEIASQEVVMQAAKQFAEAFAETPQYRKLEQTYTDFSQDTEAQKARSEFLIKQASLKGLMRLNAVSAEDRQELQRLQNRFNSQPSVLRYGKAQDDVVMIAQEIGDLLSEAIGLDYANSCRTGGCCG